MLRIAFFHANGYPPGVYTRFFEALTRTFNAQAELVAAPLIDTPDKLAPRLRWPHMFQQAEHTVLTSNADVLMGHSMGGYLALHAAAAHHGQVKHVIMIDSPIPSPLRGALLSFAKLTQLSYRFGPAPIANRRRNLWANRHEAHSHFASKAFVKRWHPGVLDDFLTHALREHNNGLTLTIPRESERDIYAYLAHTQANQALRALRRAGVRVSFIAGEQSEEMRMAGFESNRVRFNPRFEVIRNVGHLIPFDAPESCAERIHAQFVSA